MMLHIDLHLLNGANTDPLIICATQDKLDTYKRVQQEVFDLGHKQLSLDLQREIQDAEELIAEAEIKMKGVNKC